MDPERAFEQAILAEPGDDSRRLMYADWLEERGDPRGEYLRVETALAKAAPYDRGYRALRERVAELRNSVDRAWGTTFGLRQITAIEDLVYYLREFHKSWSDSPGLDVSSLPAGLPPGLALVYRELGALTEIEAERPPLAAQDHLLAPNRLISVNGMVVFVSENSGDWSCLYPADAKADDLPVYSNAADVLQGRPGQRLQKVCDSLNLFLTTFCLREAVFSSPCLVSFRGGRCPEDVLDAACRPLWLADRYVSGELEHLFYDVPGQDVLVMESSGLWLGSHSDAALRLIRDGAGYNRIH